MKKILLSFLMLIIGNTFISTNVKALDFFKKAAGVSTKKCPYSSEVENECKNTVCKIITEILDQHSKSGLKLFKHKEARIMDAANKAKEYILSQSKSKGKSVLSIAKACKDCCGGMQDASNVIGIVVDMFEDDQRQKAN